MEKYNVLGIMSGTSLDGVDLCYASFSYHEEKWTYTIPCAETVPYDSSWQNRLQEAENSSALSLAQLHVDLGNYIGQIGRDFCERHGLNPDFISSHGHTIFHQPEAGLTLQIGAGSHLAAATKLPVVCDFRTVDVALGGQGAPLVPAGDLALFANYDCRLNLGGIANLSFEANGSTLAYDVCPANMPLNVLVSETGKAYDSEGNLARSGKLIPDLLTALNALPFYQQPFPKSLGKEWFLEQFNPNLPSFESHPVQDRLHTP